MIFWHCKTPLWLEMDQAILIEVAQGHIRSLICRLTNSEPSSLYLACVPNRCYSSTFIIQGPGARHLGTTDTLQNPSKLFKLANPNCLSFSALPFFSCGSPSKGGGLNLPLVSVFYLLANWCLSQVALHIMSCLLSLGSLSRINFDVSWASPLSPLVAALDYVIKKYKAQAISRL